MSTVAACLLHKIDLWGLLSWLLKVLGHVQSSFCTGSNRGVFFADTFQSHLMDVHCILWTFWMLPLGVLSASSWMPTLPRFALSTSHTHAVMSLCLAHPDRSLPGSQCLQVRRRCMHRPAK